ncbi:MAG: hypothetical protein GDA43_18735 [Hormoscilla sp. SP5CHS1]|nr:hypothetical protein [Hormoscilla sp. SP12CHS1]MBC6454985.1 hypothetical protein [Hormoscilla sp. SP5CHS1]
MKVEFFCVGRYISSILTCASGIISSGMVKEAIGPTDNSPAPAFTACSLFN